MRWSLVYTLAQRDLRAAVRSKATVLPILIVPLLFVVLMPLVMALVIRSGVALDEQVEELARMMQALPPELAAYVEGLDDPRAQLAELLFGVAFAPFFLIIPVMVASVIAADSFAGERERGTLEALLYTPTTDLEVFAAKCLAAWTPAVAVSLGGAALFCVVVDAAMYSIVGGLLLPNASWLLMALWVSPAVAGVSLALTVIISARVSTVQAATQLSGLLVLPIVVLVLGQFLGVLALSAFVAFVAGAVLWAALAALLPIGARAFRRSEILARR